MSLFIALYSVEHPIVAPVRARRGHILTVWPAHSTHTVSVCANAPGYPVLRYATVTMGVLYGMVLNWELDGIICPLAPSSSLAAMLASAGPQQHSA